MNVKPLRIGSFVLLVAAVGLASNAQAAPSVVADQSSYRSGQAIQITFSGGPGNSTDWVGIYRVGQVPGQVASTLWQYVDGSQTAGAPGITSGVLTFSSSTLSAGQWNAFFLADNGYAVLASTAFTVAPGPQAILSTNKTIYRPGEPIIANFSGGPGNPTDWVGIYPDEVTPGSQGSTLWYYVGGSQTAKAGLKNGQLTFDAGSGKWPLPNGRWKAYFLADDGYSVLAYAIFWVGDENATALTPGGWLISPAGRQSLVGSGPLALALTPDGARLLVANAGYDHQSLMLIDALSGRVLQTLLGLPDGPGSFYNGLVLSKDGKTVYASDGTNDAIRVFALGDTLVERTPIGLPTGTWPAGLALSADGRHLIVAGNLADQVLIVDLEQRAAVAAQPVGHLPYGVALSRDGQRAYVSDWGADTLSVVNTQTAAWVATLKVGMHPSALLQNPRIDELYVADTDSDEISVVDSHSSKVLRTISLRPWPGAPVGASPNALALAPDGRTLWVADAGDNDLAQVRLSRGSGAADRIAGLIPSGWFPSGVAVAPSGATLYVINMKGLGVGPVPEYGYIGDQLAGTLSRIDVPGEEAVEEYTEQVARNDRFPGDVDGEMNRAEEEGLAPIIPARPGEGSPIKHVIYVMKENRSYDQVFGDLGRGNGDPSLVLFGETVTPNQHELARRFVTFDNLYCEGEVSADGWIWSNAASANSYNQKNWPLDYGWSNRLYDFGGFGNTESAGFPGPDPQHSFFWDRLAAKGISYRNYGFFLNGLSGGTSGTQDLSGSLVSIPGLLDHTDPSYSGWDLDLPDVERLKEWLREFRQFEAGGSMPTVQFVYLPRDHTVGTATGAFSPTAMVADNDLALGQLVDAVTHSRFWKDTAIFVIEDDAQDGPDHVDGHRTIGQVISPFTQTGTVDSTRYSTVSMLRTMELIVGVKPLTQYDALARPMRRAFTSRPDFTPYDVRAPTVSLTELNKPGAPLAAEMKRMDFSRPDAANPRILNEAIWQSVRGPGHRMPAPRTSIALRD